MASDDKKFMRRAIQLAHEGMDNNLGGPFGAVIVKNNSIIAEGNNNVTTKNDPTAHAEVVAIRKACEKLSSFQLEGCTIYTSCEPCPMCLGAIYWARPTRVVYACNRQDAANIDFDDQFIYDELMVDMEDRKIPFEQVLRNEALTVFQAWDAKNDRTLY
ncbi:nucleoside deaminase [uncultured Kriegella sp.]|uniref:nucleoside deaminase n=1 Tax=uncultured Kriegella sp. TaxID=1798910 RepID=UPI0030D80F7D|tara:strand:+ start:474314 stop:474790 length:477 start_codon:yes stop_codon:yes gene_type:complete